MGDWRRFLRLETAVAGLVIVVAVVALFLFLQLRSSEADEVAVDDELVKLKASIRSSTAEADTLRAKLEEREAEIKIETEKAPPPEFPSRNDALGLGTKLTAYVAEHDFPLNAFDTARSSTQLAGTEYPTISYALTATGPAESLIGMLGVGYSTPTGLVEGLEFSRVAEAENEWTMRLGLVIVYQ